MGQGVGAIGAAVTPAAETAAKLRDLRRERGLMTVTVSMRRDPQCVADVLAALVRSDRRAGVRGSLAGVRYADDKGGDYWPAPEEVAITKREDCDGITRTAGTTRGAFVGCVRSGVGMHVFLQDERGVVDDPCVAAGMPAPAPAVYEGAALAAIGPASRVKAAAAVIARHLAPAPLPDPGQFTDAELSEVLAELEILLRDLPPERMAALEAAWLGGGVSGASVMQSMSNWLDRWCDARLTGPGDEPRGVIGEWIDRWCAERQPPHAGARAASAGPAVAGAGAADLWDRVVEAAALVVRPIREAATTPEHAADVARGAAAVVETLRALDAETRLSADQLREAATAAARSAASGSETQHAAAVLAYVTSDDARRVEVLRQRLARPLELDQDLVDRARIASALAALHVAGYRLALEAHKPHEPMRSPGVVPPARVGALDEEAMAEAMLDELMAGGGARLRCPGTCDVRR